MENKLGDIESLPDLFSDTGIEFDFVHSTSSESSDDSFIQNLRIHERDQTPKKARKIVANPMKWKCNARKIAHQTGKSYISKRGGNVPERRVKTLKNCNLQCKFMLGETISDTERSENHDSYYSLGTDTGKMHFLISKKRLRTEQRVEAEDDDWMEDENEADNEKKKLSRQERKFSFNYFFCEGRENTGMQVFLVMNIIYIAKASIHCTFN
ncbi:hypothetical protein AVEN_225012-1 [Araneus ventricosus]|uniref:Uncharacterized protein n=1 Tax=Araneus ventricosus TaxID=182803 RepID=A0A4Y2GXI7_ARAVE|nr:hypothetical protein AVEN_225012-1 [Araneus ventricosus]